MTPSAPARRRSGRAVNSWGLACALTSVAIAAAAGAVLPAPSWASAQQTTAVQLRVLDVSPSTPQVTTTSQPLIITLAATNTTSRALTGVSISASRGDPLKSQDRLSDALAHGGPIGAQRPIPSATQPGVVLMPHAVTTMSFRTTTSTSTDNDDHGLCLCVQAAVYPLLLTARSSSGSALGSISTLLPAFDAKPAPVQVAWVWPLLDRPHRLSASTVFFDDDLAASVAGGGRLDRALAVPELLPRDQPMTLVLDPDLLDELEIMSTGAYTVRTAKGSVPGPGGQAAAEWLARLRQLLADHPSMQVALTPYGDPDVEALASRGLRWSSALPTSTVPRIADALGGATQLADIAWPAAGRLGNQALRELVKQGARTIVLPASAVSPRDGAHGTVPVGKARLTQGGATVSVALTSPSIERDVSAVISSGGVGTAGLPTLVSRVAVRAAQQPDAPHSLVITAPRYVDAVPSAAASAVRATTSAVFAEPVTLGAATAKLPRRVSRLAGSAVAVGQGLPAAMTDVAVDVSSSLPTVDSMLVTASGDATRLVTTLPIALQRLESAGWSQDESVGLAQLRGLRRTVNALFAGVRIVRASGEYTLASRQSDLPVTIENQLDYQVRVRPVVRADNASGFTIKDPGWQTIAAHSKKIVQLSTDVVGRGRIRLNARLFAPNGSPLGRSVTLAVRSTALGAIGVGITIGAGAVLALALVFRGVRQLRRRARRAEGARRAAAEREPAKAAR